MLTFYHQCDAVWAISKIQECDDAHFPTWAAYNSLVTKPTYVTNISVLPLIPGSPTDWSNLYTTLKICQGICVESNQQQKNYNLNGFTNI